MSEIQGLLPFWKEKGMTSHDCVNRVRRIFNMKKVGHGGTLDPDVSGVLPIALGKATKVLEYMLDSDKIYCGSVTFGRSTTTEDSSGETVDEQQVPATLTRDQIQEKMNTFIGEISQTPPMYSAVRVNGRHLYEYAREGVTVERPSRQVHIYAWETTSDLIWRENGETSIDFKVRCSKGTYIRTLAVDLGQSLYLPAYMSSLIRTQAGGIKQEECVTLQQLQNFAEEMTPEELADKCLLPLERALTHLSHFEMNEEVYRQVKNGAPLSRSLYPSQDYPVVMMYCGKAVAIYEAHKTKKDLMKPKKVI